jgi:hypothetical protein
MKESSFLATILQSSVENVTCVKNHPDFVQESGMSVSWNVKQKTWKRRTIYGHGRDGELLYSTLSFKLGILSLFSLTIRFLKKEIHIPSKLEEAR